MMIPTSLVVTFHFTIYLRLYVKKFKKISHFRWVEKISPPGAYWRIYGMSHPKSTKSSVASCFGRCEEALFFELKKAYGTYILVAGWIREISLRKGGETSKKKGDVYYHPPDGAKKHRSTRDVADYCKPYMYNRWSRICMRSERFCVAL